MASQEVVNSGYLGVSAPDREPDWMTSRAFFVPAGLIGGSSACTSAVQMSVNFPSFWVLPGAKTYGGKGGAGLARFCPAIFHSVLPGYRPGKSA